VLHYSFGRLSGLFHTLLLGWLCLWASPADASVLLSQTFATNAATGWNFGGNSAFTACLTAGGGGNACSTTGGNPAADGAGNGWLRLTNTTGNAEGYAYYGTSFASGQGFVIDFDFASWGGSGADGLDLFLEDASATFGPGDVGGSFSYANGCSVSGMTSGWIGVAYDEYGNFSNPSDRCKVGGPGQTPSSVAIRGPGNYAYPANGTTYGTNYQYLTGTQTATALDCPASNPGLSGPTPNTCAARPASTSVNFRHSRIIILYSAGVWTASVYVQFGSGAGLTQEIASYTLTTPPTNLRIGFAASTGSYTNYHEIRNLVITNPVDDSIVKTVSNSSEAQGDAFSYLLTVGNVSAYTSTGTTVSDTLPTASLSYQSYSVSGALTTSNAGGATTCTFTTPTLSCTVGSLPASGTGAITVNVKATAAGSNAGTAVSNTATIASTDVDINTANNTSTASFNLFSLPSLTIVKSATVCTSTTSASPTGCGTACTSGCTMKPGNSIVYTILISNSAGPSKSNVITDALSPHTALSLNYGGTSNPFTFNANTSGLTFGTPLYSSDGGVTWTYTLVSGANNAPTGFDGTVTNFEIPFTGTFAAGTTSYSVLYNTIDFK